MAGVEKLSCRQLLSVVYPRIFRLKTNEGHWTENKIAISFYRIPVACKCILSYLWVCLRRHFVCFSPVSRPRTQILSLLILAAILNKFPVSADKSVTWFPLCARVFSPAAAILESENTLGTRLAWIFTFKRRYISDQNKQGFEDKKLSRTEFTAFEENLCQTLPTRGIERKDSYCFLTSIFAFILLVILQNPSKQFAWLALGWNLSI